MFQGKNILCISAHMDDVEFGCGGLIKSLEGLADIYVLILSKNRKNAMGKVQEVRDIDEQLAALRMLAVKRENIFFADGIPGQLFPEHRQKVLEEFYLIGEQIKPDVVITPSPNDVHQDHKTVCASAKKAFKRQTHLTYEIVNASSGFLPTCFFEINEAALRAKQSAINCFKSQQDPETTTADYFGREIIEGLARMRGARGGVRYAEAFEVLNMTCYQGRW